MATPLTAPAGSSDTRYLGLFEQSLVGIAQVDLTGRFVAANARYLEIVGRSAEDLRALRMQDITHPDDLPGNLASFKPLVEGEGEPFVVEKRYVRPDGSIVWVHNSVSLVRGADGEPEGVVAVTIDVTERRRTEAELRRAEAELRRANAELEREADRRSAMIRRLSRALARAEEEERRRVAQLLHDDLQQTLFGAQIAAAQGDLDRVGRVLEEATRMARTLSHALSPPIRQGAALAPLLEWLAVRKRELHGLEVEVEVGPRVAVARDDLRSLLYHVLRELLFNVVKHSGGRRARVRAEAADGPDGPVVRVVVSDDGAGFDPAELGAATASTGLGLASVCERVELVGGRFEVESAPGSGTRATVEVPACG